MDTRAFLPIVTPVIHVVLFPALPRNKAVRKLAEKAAVAEVRRALNAYAYGEA